jgi:hypothetical protein
LASKVMTLPSANPPKDVARAKSLNLKIGLMLMMLSMVSISFTLLYQPRNTELMQIERMDRTNSEKTGTLDKSEVEGKS